MVMAAEMVRSGGVQSCLNRFRDGRHSTEDDLRPDRLNRQKSFDLNQ